ncbi:hypothetical protein [Flavobacterium capsici]|uniref:Uncharacterized protein n=1 Tax=Flavobacterium capsici TaxID=3075618 RepID=A0AA96F0B5_9FLAO|nr:MULTISPECIES: hypothetical protein [unclassified Flavobacterium]WNM20282.1 hypothetical protein RN608_06270 [Flavobacterium sp. PMR2A8]WNM21672.1 hypothetical protein RN605_13440 [Flavobacterium sp. PMTSA4]
MNKYKFHHKLLTFLKEKYETYNMEDVSKYCFTSEQLGKQLNINVNKIEEVLFSLKEFDCVDYSKNSGFKISDNGIKKQLNRFFIYKGNENIKLNLKDIVQIIIPLLSLLIATLAIYCKFDKFNKENENEIIKLKNKIEILENKSFQNKEKK